MKFSHPTESIGRSTNSHNSDLNVMSDWIESLALFAESQSAEKLSTTDIVDYLIEEQIYDSQDFCREFVGSALSNIETQTDVRLDSEYPVAIENGLVSTTTDWRQCPALSFCLVVSLLPHYSGYTSWVGGNYNQQGELFERISSAALAVWFPAWDVFRTGWDSATSSSAHELVELIAERTDETVRAEAGSILLGDEKDLGMDIAAVRRFPDGRGSLPVIFGQCASGRNWPDKLPTPNAKLWKQLVTLTHTPLRAFSLPFRLDPRTYESRRNQFGGLLLDRSRLLPSEPELEWLDDTTRDELVEFVEARLDWLYSTFAHS